MSKYIRSDSDIWTLKERFGHRNLDDEQFKRVCDIQNQFMALAQVILESTPVGREQSLALTKLEEACMFAVKAISREDNGLS